MYGALLGVQEGRSIEICNSFELLVSFAAGRVTHDAEYFNAKEKQCAYMHVTCFRVHVQVSGYMCRYLGACTGIWVSGCMY